MQTMSDIHHASPIHHRSLPVRESILPDSQHARKTSVSSPNEFDSNATGTVKNTKSSSQGKKSTRSIDIDQCYYILFRCCVSMRQTVSKKDPFYHIFEVCQIFTLAASMFSTIVEKCPHWLEQYENLCPMVCSMIAHKYCNDVMVQYENVYHWLPLVEHTIDAKAYIKMLELKILQLHDWRIPADETIFGGMTEHDHAHLSIKDYGLLCMAALPKTWSPGLHKLRKNIELYFSMS